MRIVAGTYEGFCYGWEAADDLSDSRATSRDNGNDGESLDEADQPAATAAVPSNPISLVFGYSVHVGCMKSVAVTTSGTRAGQLMVTGGVDEHIRIYDLRDRTELGELQQHNGTVTCLEFYKSSHLLTGSEDHTVCIWRVHDWALLHVLGGHKAAVTSISIHPSGRMALSVSRDRTLRLWNLLEGRCAYIKRLQGEGEIVRWSPSGNRYMTVVGSIVVVYDAATSEAIGECKHTSRVNSACFVGGGREGKGEEKEQGEEEGSDGSVVATCSDDKIIRFFKAEGASLMGQLDVSDLCQTGRVRDICHVPVPYGSPRSASSGGTLVAVTSAGRVNAWGVPAFAGVATDGAGAQLEIPLLATLSVKGEPRFTCVAACLSEAGRGDLSGDRRPKAGKKKKAKRKHSPRGTITMGARGGEEDDGVVDGPSPGREREETLPSRAGGKKRAQFSRGATAAKSAAKNTRSKLASAPNPKGADRSRSESTTYETGAGVGRREGGKRVKGGGKKGRKGGVL